MMPDKIGSSYGDLGNMIELDQNGICFDAAMIKVELFPESPFYSASKRHLRQRRGTMMVLHNYEVLNGSQRLN